MREFFQVGWTWYPSVVIGFSLWTLLYTLAIWRDRSTSLIRQIAFHIGTLVGLIALLSPLDELGDEYLFSAHMVQHLLLMFGAAPLWLVGASGWMIDRFLPRRLTPLVQWLVSPVPAFLVFVGVMWFWHVPAFYQTALEHEGVHIFEHLTFIGAALIGWWPVLGPKTTRIFKPEPPLRMLYLFLLAVPCTVLAAILSFAHAALYPFYVTVSHPFGMNALQDQHLGGLLMWLPTHFVLLVMLGFTFLKWFAESNRQSNQELAESLS